MSQGSPVYQYKILLEEAFICVNVSRGLQHELEAAAVAVQSPDEALPAPVGTGDVGRKASFSTNVVKSSAVAGVCTVASASSYTGFVACN